MRGCHGNHSITYSLPEFKLGYIRFLDSVDLGGHFGTHEKKSRGGCMVDLAGPQSIIESIFLRLPLRRVYHGAAI